MRKVIAIILLLSVILPIPSMAFVKNYIELQALLAKEPIYSTNVLRQYGKVFVSLGLTLLSAKLMYASLFSDSAVYHYFRLIFGAEPTLVDMLSVFLVFLGNFLILL